VAPHPPPPRASQEKEEEEEEEEEEGRSDNKKDKPVAEGANDLSAFPAKRLGRGFCLHGKLCHPVAANERSHIGQHVKGIGKHRQRARHNSKRHLGAEVRKGEDEHKEEFAS